jgi:sulfur relay (sulfurtransferase) DsrC/TusE family protein
VDDHETAKRGFLNSDWKLTQFQRSDYAMFDTLPSKRANLKEMVQLA